MFVLQSEVGLNARGELNKENAEPFVRLARATRKLSKLVIARARIGAARGDNLQLKAQTRHTTSKLLDEVSCKLDGGGECFFWIT